jgi:hypothetical protein
MRVFGAVALCAVLVGSAASAEKTPCPMREAGQAYPWQNLAPVKGDRYAWVVIEVDRTGRPIRCGIGENNIPDPDTRFLLCNAYKGDWRAPRAETGDPDVRTIKRRTTMIGYEHQIADQKARKAWFRAHPEERSECYPQ